jgi:hypothetical protein
MYSQPTFSLLACIYSTLVLMSTISAKESSSLYSFGLFLEYNDDEKK